MVGDFCLTVACVAGAKESGPKRSEICVARFNRFFYLTPVLRYIFILYGANFILAVHFRYRGQLHSNWDGAIGMDWGPVCSNIDGLDDPVYQQHLLPLLGG